MLPGRSSMTSPWFLQGSRQSPFGATLLVGEHAKAVKGFTHPAERTRYVWKNNAQIRQDEADYLAKGGDLKGCYVSLGKSGIVALDSCKVTEYGDLVVITVLAMTTSWHALDGVNTWGIVIHKKKPTEILLLNHMEGAGTLRLSDQANCWGGEALMMRAFTDFPLHLEAIQSGKTVDEVVKTRSADFQTKWRRSLTFFTLFDVAGMFLATARAATGGNMEYDKYDTRDLVYENDSRHVARHWRQHGRSARPRRRTGRQTHQPPARLHSRWRAPRPRPRHHPRQQRGGERHDGGGRLQNRAGRHGAQVRAKQARSTHGRRRRQGGLPQGHGGPHQGQGRRGRQEPTAGRDAPIAARSDGHDTP
ncbi:hypothetical protein N656DRAFT_435469 [Canariomyces notabilis]|uniref:Uncharacterized protein n=1 Tax=Canariomyces notabilis TaxID=2074819 RepID=A0AAN6QIZ3_9PEZI|nr:hypothetical protein N656DRAFT_435469 [Canariomyces arenarius]